MIRVGSRVLVFDYDDLFGGEIGEVASIHPCNDHGRRFIIRFPDGNRCGFPIHDLAELPHRFTEGDRVRNPYTASSGTVVKSDERVTHYRLDGMDYVTTSCTANLVKEVRHEVR